MDDEQALGYNFQIFTLNASIRSVLARLCESGRHLEDTALADDHLHKVHSSSHIVIVNVFVNSICAISVFVFVFVNVLARHHLEDLDIV